jgi:hypothetical protein
MIDYNGFRVFCESDIFAGEENLELSDQHFIVKLARNICENNIKIKKKN